MNARRWWVVGAIVLAGCGQAVGPVPAVGFDSAIVCRPVPVAPGVERCT